LLQCWNWLVPPRTRTPILAISHSLNHWPSFFLRSHRHAPPLSFSLILPKVKCCSLFSGYPPAVASCRKVHAFDSSLCKQFFFLFSVVIVASALVSNPLLFASFGFLHPPREPTPRSILIHLVKHFRSSFFGRRLLSCVKHPRPTWIGSLFY